MSVKKTIVEIRVLACCGVLGWHIPWGIWIADPVMPLVPTVDHSIDYFYLYSQLGQSDPAAAEAVKPNATWNVDNMRDYLNLDNYVHANKCDWDAAASMIRTLARTWHARQREVLERLNSQQ